MSFNFKSKGTKVASRVDSRDNIKAIAKGVVTFDGKVTKAETALTGFNFEYDEGDQNFGKEGVDISSFVVKNQVSYQVSCLFCDLDNSSSFHGSVGVLVLADVSQVVNDATPIAFKSTRINFDASPKSSRILPGSVHFARPVKWAQAMLKGFLMEYVNTDQDFFLQRVGVSKVTVEDDVVNFETYFQLEDVMVARGENPATSDKQIRGSIDVVVLAALQK